MTMAEEDQMAASNYTLVIGDKNFSSWSLRPWIALKYFGIPFAEERVRLRQPESKAEILRHSPSGKVPALKDGNGVIWDSLAILEHLAEKHPEKSFWPRDDNARSEARSVSAEMHSGFATLRNEMSMELLGTSPLPADRRGARGRYLPRRCHLVRLPPRLWRERPIPVRGIFQCGRHVRASGDAIPDLWSRPREIRR